MATDNRTKCPVCQAASSGDRTHRRLAPQPKIWCGCSDHCHPMGCKCSCHPENKKRERARRIRKQNGGGK